jgi:hypothetical protein
MMKKVSLIFSLLILSFPAAGRLQEAETSLSLENGNARPDSILEELQNTILRHRSLRALPFRGGSLEYYGLFPGAVVQDYRGRDLLHVRGSRHDEIAYSFEGADVRSVFTGENLLRFIPEALDEISLTPSPGAGYAGAAGLVRHRLRRPAEDFNFTLRGETDRFTPDYQRRLGTFSYGYANFLGLAEGRIFKDNLRFLAAAERESFNDHYRKFWDGFRFGNSNGVPLRDPTSGQTLHEITGVNELVVKAGNIPNAAADRLTLNTMLTGDFSAVTLRAAGFYNWEKQQNNDTPIRELFNSLRIPETKNRSALLSLQADLNSTKNFGAHLQFDLLRSENKTYDPVFEDDVELYRDSLAIVARGLPWSNPYGSYAYGPNDFDYFAFPFSSPGKLLASYSRTEEDGWEISGSVNKNIDKVFLNAGFAYQRRAVRHFSIGNSLGYAGVLRQASLTGQRADEYILRRIGYVDAFGYDAFANRVEFDTDTNDGPAQPSKFSAYVESRFRAKDIQIDIGLRYDRFASDARFLADPSIFPLYYRFLKLSELKTAPTYKYFLPRLTATFFATSRLTLKFGLGRYAQQPALQDVYASRGYFTSLPPSYPSLDTRAVTAEPVRLSQMDFVMAYQATPRFHLSASVFQRYTEGQLQREPVYASPGDTYPDYYVLGNDGESSAKGVELTLSYSNRGLVAWANYSLSRVNGFTSDPATVFSEDPYVEPPVAGTMPMLPLDYNQTHRGNVLLGYEFDPAAPALLQQLGLQALLRFNSGHNYPFYHLGDAFG